MERVIPVSETKQAFMGEIFYLCGYYFQHKGKRLHRAVWEAYNGEVPEGYHVHHIDGDRSNNQIENLALVPGLAHIRQHAREESRRENGRRAIRLAIEAAPAWHSSPEGKAWHSAAAKKSWAKAPMHTYVCDMCGKVYESRCYPRSGHHFCNQNCKAKYARRKKAGLV